MANFKDGIIRDGSSVGSGSALGNVKDGIIRTGNCSPAGCGSEKGKVKDYTIKGMEREDDAEMVAAYHFLVKKFL